MTLEHAQQELSRRAPLINRRYKPGYHLSVPAGWLNDPNGFGFYQGRAHLFYQFHPYDSVWGPMHWGHWISEDLVHWQDAPVAMAPDSSFDQSGCFSGTALEKDGRLYLMYTGVAPAEADGKCYQHQCVAESADGVRFDKWADNPVIGRDLLPPGASVHEFRDPKLFETPDGYRVVAASQGENGGQLLAFESPDLRFWRYAGVYLDGVGDMAECPDVFELDGKTVVIVCEMGADAKRCGSPQVTLYASGHEKNGSFCAERPLELVDCGLDFYAPQTMITPDGRRVLIGWALSWSHVMPTHTLGHGWAGMMTLPRECTLDENGALRQQPIRELQALRQNEVQLENLPIRGRMALDALAGKQREMKLHMDMKQSQALTLNLLENGDERFRVLYDRETETLTVDRSLCGYPMTADLSPENKPWAQAHVPLRDGMLDLHIFVDQSIVEIYADEGRAVMSSLAFPKGEGYGVSVEADGAVLASVQGWTLIC
ncbi:MAG: glycoside hydrolase family 32 protein [Clostridia bacterium]|nr:glycoside hydrolase family 32 protein [Clostridia bacterium]